MNNSLCSLYYITNGNYCLNDYKCLNKHIMPIYKVCTTTYKNNYCRNGLKCKFKHFIPYYLYCNNYFLFNHCSNINCSLIHLSTNSIVYNLCIFKKKYINLFIGQIKYYYNTLFKNFLSSLNNYKSAFLKSHSIATFRTEAICIICYNKASDPVTPYQRIQTLLFKKKNKFPFEVIKNCISPFILPSIIHSSCIFLKQKISNPNLLQIYRKRYVRRDEKKDRIIIKKYVPRAIPDNILPRIYLDNLHMTGINLQLHLDIPVIFRILDRSLEFLSY